MRTHLPETPVDTSGFFISHAVLSCRKHFLCFSIKIKIPLTYIGNAKSIRFLATAFHNLKEVRKKNRTLFISEADPQILGVDKGSESLHKQCPKYRLSRIDSCALLFFN